MYTVFTRNWWRWEGNKKVPDPRARKTKLATFDTEEQAWQYCQEYNATHEPGPLSRKAEYTQYF